MQETSNVNNDFNYVSLDYPKLFLLDDKSTHQQKIARMTRLAMAIMPEDWIRPDEVEVIMSEAYRSVDLEYGIEEANA